RGQSAIVGPDGSVSGSGTWSVGYDISASPVYTQAPWTDIDFPVFVLPTIFVPGESAPFPVGPAPGSAFTLEGSVQATSDGAGIQSVTSEIYEDCCFFVDTLVATCTFDASMPAETFAGILRPYSEPGCFLFEAGGQVAGSAGSSGVSDGNFYQLLTQPGGPFDPDSANVNVKVAP
ncbi:MAG: hypothetical protein HRU00_16900, partial [Myxococcales bacterium]|nr:hypothetical protein [Myxococcales bacterium]